MARECGREENRQKEGITCDSVDNRVGERVLGSLIVGAAKEDHAGRESWPCGGVVREGLTLGEGKKEAPARVTTW